MRVQSKSGGLGPDPVTGIDPAGPPNGVIDMQDVLAALAQAFVVDCSELPNDAPLTYVYDDNGNQTGRGSDTFAYDHENRLTQAVIGRNTSTYAYNGDGLRVSRTAGGATASYAWDVGAGLPVILQETAGGQTTYYVYGLDLIASVTGTTPTYYLYDGLGSTRGLTNSAGQQTVTYTYDAFGAMRTQSGSSANYWLFTGEQRDTQSWFYYLRARYYDPAMGRFLTQDPFMGSAMAPLSLNRYPYVLNNPLRWLDPWGLRNVEGTPTPTPWAGYMPCGPVGPGPGCPNRHYLDPSSGNGIWGPLANAARTYWEHTPDYLVYRAAQHLAGPVVNALTSECSQGLARMGIGIGSLALAATGVGALAEAGGITVVSASSAATSAAAAGAAAGPENIQRVIGFLPGGVVQVARSCP